MVLLDTEEEEESEEEDKDKDMDISESLGESTPKQVCARAASGDFYVHVFGECLRFWRKGEDSP